MKAAIMVAADQALTYGDFLDPEPREGWQLVDLVAAGIHPVVRAPARPAITTAAAAMSPGCRAAPRCWRGCR